MLHVSSTDHARAFVVGTVGVRRARYGGGCRAMALHSLWRLGVRAAGGAARRDVLRCEHVVVALGRDLMSAYCVRVVVCRPQCACVTVACVRTACHRYVRMG